MRISWTGVGIFFQAGAVNEVNDDSYNIITNYSYPIQCSYSSSLLLFLIALNYNIKKKTCVPILYLNMNNLLNSFQSSFLKFVLEKILCVTDYKGWKREIWREFYIRKKTWRMAWPAFFSWHHRFYNVDALRNQCLDQYFIFYYMRLQSNICTYLYYINFINTKFCYSEFSWKFVLIGYIYRALIIIYY